MAFNDEISSFLTNKLKVKNKNIVHIAMSKLSQVEKTCHSKKWLEGAKEEVFFWEKSLATRHIINRLCSMRCVPERKFNIKILDLLNLRKKTTVQVLDVGSGPVTTLGYKAEDYNINLTMVDPLAKEYETLYKLYNFNPPVRPINCSGEELLQFFKYKKFNIVYSCNALDHSENPITILENMCALLAENGLLYIDVHPNVGVAANYQGLHKWNFSCKNNDVILWNKKVKHNITSILSVFGKVIIHEYSENRNILIFSIIKN